LPGQRELWRWTALTLVLALAAGVAVASLQQSWAARARAAALTGGDPVNGRALMVRYGCSACHRTPGVWPAGGGVGPPLRGLAERVYIGGVLVNTPANLVAWIVDPRSIDSLTAMPTTGISESEARDVAAFLYSIR
jgi:cytochrome c1